MFLTIVIIGKNKALTLEKNLLSVKQLQDGELNQKEIELIYIDSDSEDNSLEIAKSFRQDITDFRIYQITGQVNAAIARNIGLRTARGEFIFFLDADMVFSIDWLHTALEMLKSNNHVAAVSGSFQETLYEDASFCKVVKTRNFSLPKKARFFGGSFLVKKAITEDLLFDEKLARHQDVDFCFQLRAKGFDLLCLQRDLGTHHTVYHTNRNVFFGNLRDKRYLYSALIVRKHLTDGFFFDAVLSVRSIVLRALFILILAVSLCTNLYLFLACCLVYIAIVHKHEANKNIVGIIVSLLMGLQFFEGLFRKFKRPIYTIKEEIL